MRTYNRICVCTYCINCHMHASVLNIMSYICCITLHNETRQYLEIKHTWHGVVDKDLLRYDCKVVPQCMVNEIVRHLNNRDTPSRPVNAECCPGSVFIKHLKGTLWRWITTNPENIRQFKDYVLLQIQFCTSSHKLFSNNRNKFTFLSFFTIGAL